MNMSSVSEGRKIKGVNFVVDEDGETKAVLIDLKRNRTLWEDFYDTVLAKDRETEPREALEDVKRKVHGKT
jgi:hypothetical protein